MNFRTLKIQNYLKHTSLFTKYSPFNLFNISLRVYSIYIYKNSMRNLSDSFLPFLLKKNEKNINPFVGQD